MEYAARMDLCYFSINVSLSITNPIMDTIQQYIKFCGIYLNYDTNHIVLIVGFVYSWHSN